MADVEDQSKGPAVLDEKISSPPAPTEADASTLGVNVSPAVVTDGMVAGVGPAGTQPGKEDGDLSKGPVPTVGSSSAVRLTSNGTAGTSHAGLSMPHPKKFSAVNINKKFMEKIAPLHGPSSTTSISMAAKSGIATPKQTPEVSSMHSRLVTAKLTSTPRPSTTGPGWSRPSSAAPSPSTPAPPSNAGKGLVPSSSAAAPQLPHAGKVIQPQPRTSVTGASATVIVKETLSVTTRPAWGNIRTGQVTAPKADARVQNDFPTAAEVAQEQTAKLNDKKAVQEEQVLQNQALQEEADTFRGVHLDPNAHHWDEMEEDDESFLGGVIDFGDGRQYKIQPSDPSAPNSGLQQSHKPAVVEDAVSVSKEERFVDDFDRSWPRSRAPLPSHELELPIPSQPSRSPLESSRVLFNERSNRLEPYSGPHQGQRHGSPGQPHPALSSRRSSRSDNASAPVDQRVHRDLPPHSQMHNVSLLQKPEASSSRSRGPPGALSPTLAADRWREQSAPRGTSPSSTSIPPISRTTSHGSGGIRGKEHYNPTGVHGERPFDAESRYRRLSASHPTPLPTPPTHPPRDTSRQLPPHLVNLTQRPRPPHPSVSPQASHVSLSPASGTGLNKPSAVAEERHVNETPLEQSGAIHPIPVVIDEEVRKAAMHSAAERARLRRQQEEEERERERERARRKAAELEGKMKAREGVQLRDQASDSRNQRVDEQQVIRVIEEAVRPAKDKDADVHPNSTSARVDSHPSSDGTSGLRPHPSQAAAVRPPPTTRRTSFPAGSTGAFTSASEAGSWRSKVATPVSESQSTGESLATRLAHPPVIPEVESLQMKPDEQLEVFDFADLGKLVGGRHSPAAPDNDAGKSTVGYPARVRPNRPVASDFFDDYIPVKEDEPSWRRKPQPTSEPIPPSSILPRSGVHPSDSPESGDGITTVYATNASTTTSATLPSSPKHHPPRVEHSHVHSQPVVSQGNASMPRSPRFKEASMSTLDYTMSRIKGVLDDMHVHEHHDAKSGDAKLMSSPGNPEVTSGIPHAEPEAKPKFVPPPLRPRPNTLQGLPKPDETFDVTGVEPPRSPKPAWNAFVVRLPKYSRSFESPSKRQLSQFRNNPHPVRWDILSWHPPVEGMSRRLLSVDAVLFPRGKPRYRVLLPKIRPAGTASSLDSSGDWGPTVNLPLASNSKATAGSGSLSSVGAFGRPGGADSAASWRQVSRVSTERSSASDAQPDDLQTVSRSPPPDLPQASTHQRPRNVNSYAGSMEPQSPRPRSQPKMPSGSAVAFYKDARVNIAVADVKPSVNFTVSSELDDSESMSTKSSQVSDRAEAPSELASGKATTEKLSPPPTTQAVNAQQPDYGRSLPVDRQNQVHRRSQDEPGKKTDSTSTASHSADPTWGSSSLMLPMKDSPSRGPDPEHLKIVWSQASDKANLPSVNSLEGIADDLTALPFTVPDVKSEDGETPPPTAPGPSSRMSIQDVTRAFQQVPSSPASASTSSQRTALSPPSNLSVPRPMSLPYPPLQHPGMRPTYGPYPSPMLSSPSPTVIYPTHMAPSPVPGRMQVNGHPPQYSQTVWVPVQPQPAGAGMMRAVPSPYGTPMIPYPSPMYTMPPSHMQNPPAQLSSGSSHRSGGMPMMSPSMSHGTPTNPHASIYPGSPVMVHTSHVPLTPGHSYAAVPAPQTQPRSPYDIAAAHHPTGHQQINGYSSTAPTAFARSAW